MSPPGGQPGRALKPSHKSGLGSGPPPVPAGADDSTSVTLFHLGKKHLSTLGIFVWSSVV